MFENENTQPPNNERTGSSTIGGKSAPPKKPAGKKETPLSCAYCRKQFLRSETDSMPFCSPRCKQVDLGMWLTESYGMPFEGESSAPREFLDEEDE